MLQFLVVLKLHIHQNN